MSQRPPTPEHELTVATMTVNEYPVDADEADTLLQRWGDGGRTRILAAWARLHVAQQRAVLINDAERAAGLDLASLDRTILVTTSSLAAFVVTGMARAEEALDGLQAVGVDRRFAEAVIERLMVLLGDLCRWPAGPEQLEDIVIWLEKATR